VALNELQSVRIYQPNNQDYYIADITIAMKLKRKVYWNPAKEQFINDNEANRMLSRPQRRPYVIEGTR
jgi:hypothetical protein